MIITSPSNYLWVKVHGSDNHIYLCLVIVLLSWSYSYSRLYCWEFPRLYCWEFPPTSPSYRGDTIGFALGFNPLCNFDSQMSYFV